MKLLFFVLVVAIGLHLSLSVTLPDLIQVEWEEFKVRHGKTYSSEIEENFRMKIYLENRHIIASHNKMNSTFKLAMNQFGDLLSQEFISLFNGYGRKTRNDSTIWERRAGTFLTPENIQVPHSMDWRKKGAVTHVKDQGQCGSCWAFSSTGALEGQHFRKSGKLISLSEQNLVDCTLNYYGNEGCGGGWMDTAFWYIHVNEGIDTEKAYPYEAKDDACRYKPKSKGADDKGYMDIPTGDEKRLKHAVASVGPIAIAIDASQESFHFYSKGIYIDDKCSSTELDHAVLIVGYGTEDDEDYWLVKNSWGTTWGDSGYIKMARNRKNQCGVATQASYPVV